MESKRPLLLLGAGASVPAGVPTAIGMTNKMTKFCEDEKEPEYWKALWAIIGALQMGIGQTVITNGVDIERVLNAAQLLGDRFALEFAPFVGAWHPIIDDLEYQQISTERFKDSLSGLGNPSISARSFRSERDAEDAIRRAFNKLGGDFLDKMHEYLSKRPDGSLFRYLYAYLTGKLIEITWIKSTDNLDYLAPVMEYARNKPVTVATLNYDNTVERSSSLKKVQCSTGIREWANDESFPVLTKGIDLIKLHGSVKWYWSSPKKEDPFGLKYYAFNELEDKEVEDIIKSGYDSEVVGKQLAVIFGGHNKLTAAGPFLDLLTKFKTILRQSSELIVIGYSFRDQHINQCIAKWLSNNSKSKIIIIEREGALAKDSVLYQPYQNLFANGRIIFEPIGAEAGLKKYFS